jgi:hypothetical protein
VIVPSNLVIRTCLACLCKRQITWSSVPMHIQIQHLFFCFILFCPFLFLQCQEYFFSKSEELLLPFCFFCSNDMSNSQYLCRGQ